MEIVLQNMCEANSDETIRGATNFFQLILQNLSYDNLNDIFDNIYEDFRIDGDYEYNVYNLIYNNIYVQIVSDSDYIQSEIIFKYIESQISINDLTLIKNTLFSAFDKNKKFYER